MKCFFLLKVDIFKLAVQEKSQIILAYHASIGTLLRHFSLWLLGRLTFKNLIYNRLPLSINPGKYISIPKSDTLEKFQGTFSGTLVKISNCKVFSPFETIPGSLIRDWQFLSDDNRAILKYAPAQRICPLKNQLSFLEPLDISKQTSDILKKFERTFPGKILTTGHQVIYRFRN